MLTSAWKLLQKENFFPEKEITRLQPFTFKRTLKCKFLQINLSNQNCRSERKINKAHSKFPYSLSNGNSSVYGVVTINGTAVWRKVDMQHAKIFPLLSSLKQSRNLYWNRSLWFYDHSSSVCFFWDTLNYFRHLTKPTYESGSTLQPKSIKKHASGGTRS